MCDAAKPAQLPYPPRARSPAISAWSSTCTGVLYAREHGLDTTFEPYVAKPLADFVLGGSGRLWIAEEGDRMVGSIALVDAEPGVGQLRWFLVVPEARGTGLGRRLLDEALAYARQRGLDAHLSCGASRP